MVGAMHDITIRKSQEHHLKLLESVITNTTDAVLITEAYPFDELGPQIIYVNEAFSKMSGYSSEEVIGKTPRMFQEPNSNFLELKKVSDSIRDSKPCEIVTINYRKNAEEYYCNMSISPIMDAKGTATHFISIQRDITNRIQEEKQLKNFADDLYKHNQELQQFAYVVSHNLRSPVANIMGLASLLEMDYNDPETVERCTKDLQTSVHSLDTVIRDLSNILSITDGSVELTKEKLDLAELIYGIKKDLSDVISKCKVIINIPLEHYIIKSHKAYLYSIFYNLISNAIKYRSDKTPVITITCKLMHDAILISLADNGMGIDLNRNQHDLFKPYKRFNTGIEGKGLGLFLVKSHVEVLKGTIDIESRLGSGTTFHIKMPVNN